MALPGVTGSIKDPGLAVTKATVRSGVFFGPTSAGTVNTVYTFTRLEDFATKVGNGPVVQEAALALQRAGGPVYLVKTAGSVAGANGAVTRVGAVGPAMALSGTPILDLDAIAVITASGALGTGKFKYYLDGLRTPSPEYTVPVGGVFAIPGTGVTMTWSAGTLTAGETYAFTSTGPMANAADIAAGVTALKAQPQIKYRAWRIAGRPASSSAGNTLFAGVSTQIAGMKLIHRYFRCMMDAGIEASAGTYLTTYSAAVDDRILLKAGWDRMATALPMIGYGLPKFAGGAAHFVRALKVAESENLGRTASGPLEGVVETEFDEGVLQVLSAGRIESTRTFADATNLGFFATEGLLMSSPGSDFDTWERGVVMDVACEEVVAELSANVNENFTTAAGGTLDPGEAKELGDKCKRRVDNKLLRTKRANGKTGQISASGVAIDTSNDFLSTQEILADVALRPLGRGRTLKFTIGYTKGPVSGEEAA